MRYYKIVNNGYITAIGTGNGGTEVTQFEYNEIAALIHNKPQRTNTVDYHLKADLTWESYNVEPIVPSEEIDADEALTILTGGAT